MAAEAFYCERLGFRLAFANRAAETDSDPCYFGVERDGVTLHLSSHTGDAVVGGVVNILVDDVDGLHSVLVTAGVAIHVAPVDQSWGAREMYVRDPDGNTLRFVASRH